MHTEEMVRKMSNDYQALNNFREIVMNLLKKSVSTKKTDLDFVKVRDRPAKFHIYDRGRHYYGPQLATIHIENKALHCKIATGADKRFRKSQIRSFKKRVSRFAKEAGFEIKITESE